MVATVAEVEIPAVEFALSQSFSELGGLACEIERVVAHGDDRLMPFVWVRSDENTRNEVETILKEDPSVETIELLADVGDEWLYQMEWIDQIETLIQIIVREEGTVLAAMGDGREWHLRIIFSDQDGLSRTYDYCDKNGLTLDILNIYQLEESRQGRFGLTDEQQDTLTLAYEAGYYNVPRNATANDLADELGVSHQAVSERLRRGHGSLVENALILGQGANDPDKK
ncbi:helix-turn-helix domain-containing protein [Haladaptatus cibarius]|uniref:helix-turn-helix domain-containing protein n=1 Tax=Haladaptatus cibarius TaxID=453847 RepID=UPI0006790AD6|nr:helix-turn-helix domain-containing protein [Haladaptatus cibarius]